MSNILEILQDLAISKKSQIDEWFAEKQKNISPFIYNSVDIRFSGTKIAPVDTNIFPAGFNNLSDAAISRGVLEVKEFVAEKNVSKIVIITEFHTRNLHYLRNVNVLKSLFEKNELEVKLAYLPNDEVAGVLSLEDSKGEEIILNALESNNKELHVNGFIPDLVIVNNDLTDGSPEILHDVKQPVLPPIGMGWYKRTKHSHFLSYNSLSAKFANDFGFDPFFITTELGLCEDVNFKERKGLECIAIGVEKTLKRIKEKYDRLGIKDVPYVFVKANRGTYGMGIMTAKSADDVYNINKKGRNKMNVIKSNTQNEEILIQEGIATLETYENHVCESFIYLVNGNPIGTILRVNENKDHLSNLNSSGAQFVAADDLEGFKDKTPAYNIVARLAALACVEEHKFRD